MITSRSNTLCAAALAAALGMAAPLAAEAAAAHPNLQGFWEQMGDRAVTPPPPLVPEAAARVKAQRDAAAARLASGVLFAPNASICVNRGMNGTMGDSAPTHIIQSPTEIAMFFEPVGAPRHIYMDGRDWPDPKTLKATTTGYSIGHWEGDTLVVETRGFDTRHGQGPAGGYTSKTRLVEHYKLADGGKKLLVTFTYTDPAIWTAPFTYTWTYFRDPPETYAAELFCDSSDPKEAQSVVPPPQN